MVTLRDVQKLIAPLWRRVRLIADRAIVTAIIQMAKSLHLLTIDEGRYGTVDFRVAIKGKRAVPLCNLNLAAIMHLQRYRRIINGHKASKIHRR